MAIRVVRQGVRAIIMLAAVAVVAAARAFRAG